MAIAQLAMSTMGRRAANVCVCVCVYVRALTHSLTHSLAHSHTLIPLPLPLPTLTPAVTCKVKWTRKNSYYANVGHGKCPEGDVFADLEAAKEACIAAGDCKAIATQKNLCKGKYRVVHGAQPGLQPYPNGITTHKMRAYEATDLDCG